MLVNASLFIAAVNGLIRIGATLRGEYESRLRGVDIALPGHVVNRLTPSAFDTLILDELVKRPALWSDPENPLSQLFNPGATFVGDINLNLDPNVRRALIAQATDIVARDIWDLLRPGDANANLALQLINAEGMEAPTPLVMLTHKNWADPAKPTIWGELGREVAITASAVIAAQPDVIGLRGRTAHLIGGLASQLHTLIGDDAYVAANRQVGFGERAVRLFARAALNTMAENPSLALRDEQWGPVVQGFLKPLCDEVNAKPGRYNLALDQLQRLLTGPMAHGLLKAVSSRETALLTGKVGQGEALGVVTREILADLVSVDAATFDIRTLFTGDGAVGVLTCALDSVERQPELFAKGDSAEAQAKRTFLKSLATAVKAAPPPYDKESLRPDIAAVALDTASVFFSLRLVEKSGSADWERAAADIGAHIVREVFEGFRRADSGPTAATVSSAFDRGFAIDVLKIIATHVAQTPGMVVGGKPRPEVASFAKAIALLIAEDRSGLLTTHDWRTIIATACDLAARNPGALFAIDADSGPDQQIAVTLIARIFTHAGARFQADSARQQGRLLFGATLRDAVTTTLEAAASVVLRPKDAATHAEALTAFVARLEALAASEDRTLRMGAGEWNHVFRHFAAAILTHGDAAAITDDEIRAVLLGLDPRTPSAA
jgi:hypothetical protein